MEGIVRYEGIIRQELYALAEYYNINLLGMCLTANLPNRGKHVAHDGQAACPIKDIKPFGFKCIRSVLGIGKSMELLPVKTRYGH